MNNLKDKKVLLCVTGSIAAYKACEFIRLLKKQQCQVQVVMSKSSENFIGKLSLSALSDNIVLTEEGQTGLEHVKFAIDFDAIVILPATANIICKASSGIADDIVSTILSICEQPKLFAPAMNFRMWQSKATQLAVKTLRENDYYVMNPEEGHLASLHKGEGRLPKLHDAMNKLCELFNIKLPLKGKKVVVTAGPTREAIDPVRFISNKSSGKMGYALAQEARNLGAKVELISGPVSIDPPAEVNVTQVETADDMYNAVSMSLDVDYIIMCAAVSDYSPQQTLTTKIKRDNKNMIIKMEPTADIIKSIAKKTNAIIIAFALETCNSEENAIKKMMDKKVDYIALNHPTKDGCGIESNFNSIILFDKNGDKKIISKDRKDRVAKKMLEYIIND